MMLPRYPDRRRSVPTRLNRLYFLAIWLPALALLLCLLLLLRLLFLL
jgi:hypothetical protein